jgi:hypothetical protein
LVVLDHQRSDDVQFLTRIEYPPILQQRPHGSCLV